MLLLLLLLLRLLRGVGGGWLLLLRLGTPLLAVVAVLVLQICGLAVTQLLLVLHGVVWMLLVWVLAGVVLALGVGRPVRMVVRLSRAQGGDLAVGVVARLL